jgi:hypothetical protein
MSLTIKEIKQVAIAAPLTGYAATTGAVVATDTILQALQKLDGSINVTINQKILSIAGNYSQSIM